MNDSLCYSPASSQSTSTLQPPPSSVQGSSSLATMDVTVLQALCTLVGDMPFLVEVINCYLAETPIHLQGLRTAIHQKDRAAVCYAAHSLKSSSAMVGAIAFASLCAQLEALSQSTSTALADFLTLLAPLEAEYERVQAALARTAQMAQDEGYLKPE